ncbi:MAG TPA: hypothetical protein DCR12_01585 [Lachnospiraceae bacterium]|nr:hypothetical protein [Lachnospiraceae bacterium]
MIKKLIINNFKSIDRMELNCSSINIFIGTNSSGKSTVLQSLLLVLQNNAGFVGFNGNYLKLGEFDDVRCRGVKNTEDINISIEDASKSILSHDYIKTGDCIELKKNVNGYILDDIFNSRKMVQYLSCQRIGPMSAYEKDMTINDEIGINGEYAISYLNIHGNNRLEEKICKDKSNQTLMGQVNWWLKRITGTEIVTEDMVGTDYVKAAYNNGDIKNLRPNNVGAGISYLISILIMCLASDKNAILVIENPEIHLHPAAQAKVCEFLYFIGYNGRQIFVESHSDHIFNGFRVGIAQNNMDNNLINISFMYLENVFTRYIKVKIGKYGRVENQRKDLFDQFDIDMRKMIGV